MQHSPPPKMITPRLIDLDMLEKRDRTPAWRSTAATGFELDNLPDDFTAAGRLYQLGPVSLTRSTHPQQTFTRTKARARRDGVDGFLCSIELSSGFVSIAEEASAKVEVRKVTLWDMAKPSIKIASAGETLCAAIDRDALSAVLPMTDGLHGLTLGSLGSLFVEHVLSMERAMTEVPDCASADLGRATIQLLSGCVKAQLGAEEVRPRVAELMAGRAERYIIKNMRNPELSPEQVANALGLSRTSLYNLFKDQGGVSSRIRDIRLQAARSLLEGDSLRRVGEVAYLVGFRSETQFSRAFRAHFGGPPGQMRRSA